MSTKSELQVEVKRLRRRKDYYKSRSEFLEEQLKESRNNEMDLRTHSSKFVAPAFISRFAKRVAWGFAIGLAMLAGGLLSYPANANTKTESITNPVKEYGEAPAATTGPQQMLASVRLGWGGGSATIISIGQEAALGLSCGHCFSNVQPGYKFKVTLPYKSPSLPCTLLAKSSRHDLALFSIDGNVDHIRFACPVPDHPVAAMAACGYPGGVGPNVKWVIGGSVCKPRRDVSHRHRYTVKTGRFYGGDSGGNICSKDGCLLGVITHGSGRSLYATPHETVYKFIKANEPKIVEMRRRGKRSGRWHCNGNNCYIGGGNNNYKDEVTPPAPAPPWRRPNESLPDGDLKKDQDRRKAITEIRKELENIRSQNQVMKSELTLLKDVAAKPGVDGKKGDDGLDGNKGDKGDNGVKGDKGDPGEPFDPEQLNILLSPYGERLSGIEELLEQFKPLLMQDPPLTAEEIVDAINPKLEEITERLDDAEQRISDIENKPTPVPIPIDVTPGNFTEIQLSSGVSHYVLVYDAKNPDQLTSVNQFLKPARSVHPYIHIVPTSQVPFSVVPFPQLVTYNLKGEPIQIDKGLVETQRALIRISRKEF